MNPEDPQPGQTPEPAREEPANPSLFGLGFDAKDQHSRLTRGPEFVVMGGSGRTHDRLVDRSMAFMDLVRKYGRRTQDLSEAEYYSIIDELGEPRKAWMYLNRPK